MTTAKQFIGLLNTTLKGIRIVSGEDVDVKAASCIMRGIYFSISKYSIANEFKTYCKETYQVDIS
jgi:hypothetical protein